jgi:TM2 domain-containing membrane protein YozV
MVERGQLERSGLPLRGWQVSRPVGRVAVLTAFLLPAGASASRLAHPGLDPVGMEVVLPPHEMAHAVPGDSTVLTPADAPENQRWVAAALTVTLGPFGAHRLYLGTTAKVPIVYGVTFGGFFVLCLIDLGHLLFTRDLSRFEHNDRVFMWAKPREPLTPP